jgi:hypothetical protein
MAVRIWQGSSAAVPQLNTVTPASVGIGNTFTLTFANGKSVTYTAAAATVVDVTAGLLAAIAASTEPELRELTAADLGTALTLTGPSDGTPFTQTSSATGGTATLTTVVTRAAAGPNDWSVAANWSGGAVPVTGDDVTKPAGTPPIRFGLAQSGVALASLEIYSGPVGLPARNAAGYFEYRDTYLHIKTTVLTVDSPSDWIKLDTDNAAMTGTVYAAAAAGEDNDTAGFLWKGTHASNVVNVDGGNLGIAVLPGEAATVATLRVGGAGQTASVRGGPALTLGTLQQSGGDVALAAAVTTVNMTGGTLTATGGSTVTAGTLNIDGGKANWNSSGTITNLNVSDGGEIDFRGDVRPRTVTNCTLYSGAALDDDFATVTFTNGFTTYRCDLSDLKRFSVGTHRTYTVAPGP